ncbi:MAG: S41 family peptidase [Bacteroidales bacterium]|nr:S41 family peptidase [Bacteroidales bacterium]MDD4822887.1 S41 family peptidase [Bacteroidales bacterium]
MKKKYVICAVIHLVLIVYMLFNQNLLVNDIIEMFLLVLVMSFLFSNVFFLFKKKTPYIPYIQSELFKSSIVLIALWGLIIYSTQFKSIAKEEAIGDLDVMIEKLEHIHPDIYYCLPKDSFEQVLMDYKKEMPDKISELELYKGCARLTSLFKDAHTKPVINFMQLAFRAIFPNKIRIMEEKIYVIDNLTWMDRIPPGSEIVAINGRSTSQFIDEMSQLVSFENIAWRNRLITDPFNIAIWNNFGSYTISYKQADTGKIVKVHTSGGVLSKLCIAYLSKRERKSELEFKVLPDNIGYLGFHGCNDIKGYEKFYKQTFKEIQERKIRHLIIDIRNNGGGHSVIGAELMQYLFNQPFKELDSLAFKMSKEIEETGKMAYYIKPKEGDWGKLYKKVNTDPYLPRDNPLRFTGKYYILLNNGTFSAACMFASPFKCYGDGILIGEETGGITVGFGDVHSFSLPHSDIKVTTSWKKFWYACGIDDRKGIIPDYFISNSIEDEILHKDRVLEYTLELIKNKVSDRLQINSN